MVFLMFLIENPIEYITPFNKYAMNSNDTINMLIIKYTS